MGKIILEVKIRISDEDIKDLLDTAGRGAKYWCDNELDFESETDKVIAGETVKIYDRESEEWFSLNLPKVKKGLTLMSIARPQTFADLITKEYDQFTGDVFLQMCLFDDVIYS